LAEETEESDMKSAAPAKNPPPLDDTDLEILTVLVDEGRLTNAAIAHRVGIAESTCANRIRALRDQGVIEGFRAHLNLAALGRPIEAIVKVRLSSHNRDNVMSFHDSLARMPGVLAAFHVAGEDDYLLHVAVPTPQALRDLVLDHITVNPAARHTETQLVFEVVRGPGVLHDGA
jgi:DNA-binding Lrp family transcriptional regulator